MSRMLGGDLLRSAETWTALDQYDQQHPGCPASWPMRWPAHGSSFAQSPQTPGAMRTGWRPEVELPQGCSSAFQLLAEDDGNPYGHKLDADTWFLWRMDEEIDGSLVTVPDATGGGRELTALASSASNAAVPRGIGPRPNNDGWVRYGDAATFVRDPNGSTTDYIGASDATMVAAAKTQYTIEFFIAWDGTASKTLWTWGSTTNPVIRLDIRFNGALNLTWYVSTVAEQHATDSSTIRLPKNKWVHVGIVKNATEVRSYIDGSLAHVAAIVAQPNGSDATIHLYNNVGVNLHISSAVKDLKFTTRAKTDGEIDTAARLCRTTFELPVEVDTLLMYRLNEKLDTLIDSGPHKMHLYPSTNTAYARATGRGPTLLRSESIAGGSGSSNFSYENFYGSFGQQPIPDSLGYATFKMREMLQRADGYTFECWYKLGTSSTIKGVWSFSDPGQVSADLNFLTVDITADRKIKYWSEFGTDSDSIHTSVNSIPEGTHHLALRINPTSAGSHSLDIFVDGAFVETISGITKYTGAQSTSSTFQLGVGSEEASQKNRIFHGFLDDVRFSGRPRTDEEILESYLRGYGTDQPGLTVVSPPIGTELEDDEEIVLTASPDLDSIDEIRLSFLDDPDATIYNGAVFAAGYTDSEISELDGVFTITLRANDGWPSTVTQVSVDMTTLGNVQFTDTAGPWVPVEDAAPPVITIISPTPGVAPGDPGGFPLNVTQAKATPVVVQISDLAPGIRYVCLTVKVATTVDGLAASNEEVVYRRGQFRGLHIKGSTQRDVDETTIELTIKRQGGWSGKYLLFAIDALDGSGNLAP